MKMRMDMKTVLRVPLALTAALALAGCTDNKYDFDLLDKTLGLGGDRLELPVGNSTSDIFLDDLLKVNEGDSTLVRINPETGDYVLRQVPKSMAEPVDVELKEMSVAGPSHVNPQNAEVKIMDQLRLVPASIYNMVKGATMSLSSIHDLFPSFPEEFHMEKDVVVFDYLYDVPPAVASMEWADIDMTATMTLTVPRDLIVIKNMTVKMPPHLRMSMRNAAEMARHHLYFDEKDNTVWFDNRANPVRDGNSTYTPTGETFEITFDMNRVMLYDKSEENCAKIVTQSDGTRQFLLRGQVDMDASVVAFIVPDDQQAPNPVVGVTFEFDTQRHGPHNIGIDKVRGVFTPDVPLKAEDLGTVTINDIPDFLDDNDVKVDLDNPQLILSLKTTLPLGAAIACRLYSTTYPQGIRLGTINGVSDGNDSLRIPACPVGQDTAYYKVMLCAHQTPEIAAAGYTQVIADPNLAKLITRLQKGMQILFDNVEAKALRETTELTLGRHFKILPDYAFEAPLAFGDNAVIVYRKTEANLNKDIDKLSLAEGTYVEVTGAARSRLPLNLKLSLTPIDKDSVAISGLEVIHDNGGSYTNVAGSKEGETITQLNIKVHETTPGAFKRLDGFTIRAEATSGTALEGVTLNSKKHTLKLEQIKATIVGKVIYNAN